MTQTPSSVSRGGGELLQTDRRGETGRPGPDDDHVILHPLAFDFRHSLSPLPPMSSAADYRGSARKRESRDAALAMVSTAEDVRPNLRSRRGARAARW